MKNNVKLLIIFSFIAVFLVGGVAGYLVEKHLILPPDKKTREERRHPHFPTLQTMAQELELTPEQQEKIKEIFNRNEKRMKDLRSLIYDRLSTLRSQLKNEIKSVLTEDQRLKFEAMIDKYIQQRKKEKRRKYKTEKGEDT
ncbi:MAG: Spy/CpxP family protein refolding chaperone [Candidatus Aminicenantes bacterium]